MHSTTRFHHENLIITREFFPCSADAARMAAVIKSEEAALLDDGVS